MTERPILVVDDDAISRFIIARALSEASLDFVAVASGREALECAEFVAPQLILLDLVMPELDGFDVLTVMRGRPSLKDTPVVVLTALDTDEDIVRAFECGADDFVRKPFRPAELLARIRGQLRLRETVALLEQKERHSRLLSELTEKLTERLDFRGILFALVQRLADFVKLDRASIVLVGDDPRVGYVVATSDDEQVRNLPIDLSNYPEIDAALRDRSPLVIPDLKSHPLFASSDADRGGFRSIAIVPIMFQGAPMGVLALRAKHAIELDARFIDVCLVVSHAMAIALRNAKVLSSLQEESRRVDVAREEVLRRVKMLERYRDVFESSAEGILVFDATGAPLFSNPRARSILGATEESLQSKPLEQFVLPDDRERVLAERDRVAKEPGPHEPIDLRIPRSDGSLVVLSGTFSYVLRDDAIMLFSFRDVSEERRLADELGKTKNFLEKIVESSVDAIISVDQHGKIMLVNAAAERIFLRKASDVVGSDVRRLYPEQGAEAVMRAMREGGGKVVAFRTEILDGTGELVPVLVSATLLYEGGAVVGSVGVLSDLRDRVHMETQLAEAQKLLLIRERQAAVVELAGAAAHELNQPLTSVMGYAELLKRRLSPESSAYSAAQIIYSEVERMAEIVRKFGRMSRYETKEYVGTAKIVDLDRSSAEQTSPSSRP